MRVLVLLLALGAGVAIGFMLCRARSVAVIDELGQRSEGLQREIDALRDERDRLAGELAQSHQAGAALRDASDTTRRELEAKLTRLEQLIAALVGTRSGEVPSGSPTAASTPGGEGVRQPD